MSDNNDAFAARLARIQNKGAPQSPDLKPRKPRLDPYDKPLIQTRANNHLFRNTMIWTVLLGVLGAGGWYGAKSMVGEDNLTLASLSEGFGTLSQAAGNLNLGGGVNLTNNRDLNAPAQLRKLQERGWSLQSPAIATPDKSEVDITQITVGFVPPTSATAPGQVIPFDANTTCTLRRPQQGEVVTNIRLHHGLLDAQMQIFSEEDLAEAVTKNVEGYTRHQKPYMQNAKVMGHVDAVDVVLTDTSGPLYVVLQSLDQDIIWNLLPAQGVQIAHVAMIGNDSGLVDLPAARSFEALRISDFVTKHEFGNDDEIRDCMIRPWRSPEPHWGAAKLAAEGNMLYVNQLKSYSKGQIAFNTWYTQTLGVDADTNLTSVNEAAHVLAGPMPTTPVTYLPITDRAVHMTRNDYIKAGPAPVREAEIAQMQLTLVTAAAGGDIALLTPPMMKVQP